ncbi:Cobyrinic acid ac-diamide synthase [Oscillochloris trichoides DG-6]|uniref:Cobyrinic acid ac-diamide synthase n=1 Tax=Oscillochloris trichoides DG-6 TaxID=765420 RepID=E1IEC9_9CHLR|nr:ParA family protein [Oscillochloris trichoides]EFO80455.1 Cobyrinic acid ac-diamide synthase [Oscillochloris trichoides DG-6]
MGRVITVTNLKGGIGKTTTVVNLSAGFALRGSRVLLIDTDAQGNLAMALGVQPRRTLYDVLVDGAKLLDCVSSARPNLDLIAADATLLTAQTEIARRPDWARVLDKALAPVRSHYDVILIDSGGSLTLLNVNAISAATDILVPTTVEPFALKGLEVLFQQLKRIKGNTSALRAIVPTLYDTRTRQSVELLDTLRERYGNLVLDPIRVNVRLSECTAEGKTIYEYDPRSRGALDYAQLVEQMSTRIQLGPATPPPAPIAAPTPLVNGVSAVNNATCPNCGRPLQRASVAGYRILYCDHCKYRRQELAAGERR